LPGTLEGVHAQVGQYGCAKLVERFLPHFHAFRLLLQENDLPGGGGNAAKPRAGTTAAAIK
jgi:hypothetical protein